MKNIGADSVVYYLKASFHRENIIILAEHHLLLVDHSEKYFSKRVLSFKFKLKFISKGALSLLRIVLIKIANFLVGLFVASVP